VTAENTSASAAPDTIVLVHGFWVTPLSWEKWAERYESKGYRVLIPTYPGFEGGVETLRDDPSPIEALHSSPHFPNDRDRAMGVPDHRIRDTAHQCPP
jgi:hypothetical protein